MAVSHSTLPRSSFGALPQSLMVLRPEQAMILKSPRQKEIRMYHYDRSTSQDEQQQYVKNDTRRTSHDDQYLRRNSSSRFIKKDFGSVRVRGPPDESLLPLLV